MDYSDVHLIFKALQRAVDGNVITDDQHMTILRLIAEEIETAPPRRAVVIQGGPRSDYLIIDTKPSAHAANTKTPVGCGASKATVTRTQPKG